MKVVLALAVCLAAAPCLADVCGTGPATQQAAEELARFVRVREGVGRAAAEGVDAKRTTRVLDDFLIVRADDRTVPFDDPADLEGLSLHFTRRSATTFGITRTSLMYESALGTLLEPFGRGASTRDLPLRNFTFPFGTANYSSLTLSVTRGIHFTDRPLIPTRTFDALEMLTSSHPLVAPLLDYVTSPGDRPHIWVRETPTSITITWRPQVRGGSVDYDVQAVLFGNGDIRFSYRTVRNIGWGGVVLTTGTPDAWLSHTNPLATIADPAGDVEPSFEDARDMLDITALKISRVAGSSLLELRLTLATPLVRDTLPRWASYVVFLGDSINRVELFVDRDQMLYRLPRMHDNSASNAVRIRGNDIIMYVAEEMLALADRRIQVWAHTAGGDNADALTALVDLGNPGERAEADFSTIGNVATSKPLVESFSLGKVNVYAVWERVKNEMGFRDAEVDAVAIYSAFASDLLLASHGAYATLSNPGVDGISAFSKSNAPRTPALLNMNALDHGHNADAAGRTRLLLHELGHRWLYYFDIMEAGEARRAVNPLGYHPAQWVHTPAAFPVVGSNDSSVMGGTSFLDLGGGSFRTPPRDTFNGYSWHELYLMGLASADEVPPWFYLRNATPRLGDEYYPPYDLVVHGMRVDVGVQQIVQAMGPRNPSYRDAQKEFRVLFVILERASTPLTTMDRRMRTDFEEAFAKATGGRGRVITSLSTPRRRRPV